MCLLRGPYFAPEFHHLLTVEVVGKAAAYENADLIRQAATLYLGLINNHPRVGGNKRTATTIVNIFLERNGMFVAANAEQTLRLVLAMESDQYQVDDIEAWLHQHSIPLP